MAKPGPKPVPTQLRMLQGGLARRGQELEPKPPVPDEMPDPPFYLSGHALAEWNRVIEDLYSTGVYANVDQTMLAAYCMAFGRWVQAELDLERMAKVDPNSHGVMIKTTNGNAIQNPLVGVASTARRDMQRLAAEFGLTPSSRAGLRGEGSRDHDPIADRYGL